MSTKEMRMTHKFKTFVNYL
uniref:Uncharacterized protein n=1 Tax=Anguilla anguilla TaxID=7936 RepID=A0A0E9QN06_ANGAN